jgi:hypothetical protein
MRHTPAVAGRRGSRALAYVVWAFLRSRTVAGFSTAQGPEEGALPRSEGCGSWAVRGGAADSCRGGDPGYYVIQLEAFLAGWICLSGDEGGAGARAH